MRKNTRYHRCHFPAEVLEDAVRQFEAQLPAKDKPPIYGTLQVDQGQEEWNYDNLEEFFAAYRRPHSSSQVFIFANKDKLRTLTISEDDWDTIVTVTQDTRPKIETVAAIFDREATKYTSPEPTPKPLPPPTIFIGHGHNS